MAIYLKGDDNEYHQINAIPTEGSYVLNDGQTYCTEPDNETNKIYGRVAYDSGTKTLSVSTLTKKDTKCYLYFEKQITSKEVLENTLKQSSLGEVNSFTGTACGGRCDITTQNGIYEAEDDYGTSYYYRGTVDNNWLIFGQDTNAQYIWWRIIRVNGNGTIRLIYAGTSSDKKTAPPTTGDTTMIKPKTPTSSSMPYTVYFNETSNDNTYVGYKYGSTGQSTFDETHTNASNSTILDEIVNWYENNTNLNTLATDYIDVNTGFCGDRQVDKTANTSYQGNGYGTQQTAYAPWGRVYNTGWKSPQTPTLKCGYNGKSIDKKAQERDLYTGPNANANGTKGSNRENIKGNNTLPVPIGLITSDEVVYAGGFGGQENKRYWLYTNQHYWTMSPSYYYYNGLSNQIAEVFRVFKEGTLSFDYVNSASNGIRPVINLKSTVKITTESDGGEGSRTNPYIINTN